MNTTQAFEAYMDHLIFRLIRSLTAQQADSSNPWASTRAPRDPAPLFKKVDKERFLVSQLNHVTSHITPFRLM